MRYQKALMYQLFLFWLSHTISISSKDLAGIWLWLGKFEKRSVLKPNNNSNKVKQRDIIGEEF